MTTPSVDETYGIETPPQAKGESYDPRVSPISPESPQQHQSQPHANISISIIRQRKERRLRWANLVLRSGGLLFSFLSFVIMAANDNNGSKFDKFEEYRYSLAISVLAFIYLVFQLGKVIYVVVVGYNCIPEIAVPYIDFIGDQMFAYLLMSSSSSAASLTDNLRDGGDSKFTDMAAASLTMSFMAFTVFAASSLLSALALSRHIAW